VVIFETSLGDISIELMTEEAPVTTENFRRYVQEGFYDDTIFHRVIPGFVIQGGGHAEDMSRKPTRDPIKNEADNGVKNLRGTLSMARTQDKDSATSQFFINTRDNDGLNYTGKAQPGYCAFGRVVVVDVPAEGSELGQYIAGIAQQQLQTPLEPLSRRHPLRRQPFLFAALPIGAQRQPVQVFINGGIVMMVGNLGSMWGLDEELSLPRNTIRTAQEFGINLLHYAWQRRLMTGLQD